MISLLASKSCEKRSKGKEQTWCRASKSARGDGKFAANAATPLQHASAGDSPPTTLLYFSSTILYEYRSWLVGNKLASSITSWLASFKIALASKLEKQQHECASVYGQQISPLGK